MKELTHQWLLVQVQTYENSTKRTSLVRSNVIEKVLKYETLLLMYEFCLASDFIDEKVYHPLGRIIHFIPTLFVVFLFIKVGCHMLRRFFDCDRKKP